MAERFQHRSVSLLCQRSLQVHIGLRIRLVDNAPTDIAHDTWLTGLDLLT